MRSDRGRLLLQAPVRLPALDPPDEEPPDERQGYQNEDGLSEESKHAHGSAAVRREVRKRVPSLMPQRRHRIDARRPPRGPEARQQRGGEQDPGREGKRVRIVRAGLEQEGFDDASS